MKPNDPFSPQILQTNAVQHLSEFEVQNELAWVLDKATFQYHRMQRTPIKLKCYALEMGSADRVEIGYIMLDLRSAQQTQTVRRRTCPGLPLRKGERERERETNDNLDEDETQNCCSVSWKGM